MRKDEVKNRNLKFKNLKVVESIDLTSIGSYKNILLKNQYIQKTGEYILKQNKR